VTLLLLLLAALLLPARSFDPFRPALPAFPRSRLARTGLDEDTVDRLASEFDALDARRRVEFRRFVSAHSDDAIRDRFAEGVQGVEQPEQPAEPTPAPSYEELNALTVDELEDRLREWNETHPQQHLAIAGRKGEKIGRLLDAYEQEASGQLAAAPVEVSEPVQVATAGTEQPTGGTTTAADAVLATAPTATTPEGTPETAPAAPVAPAGTVESPGAPAGAPAPAQTPGAEPGSGVAPSTSTPE
jgi:hypothetical protein